MEPVAVGCDCATCKAIMAKPLPTEVVVAPPRAVPTAWPLAEGQLDPAGGAAPSEPAPVAPADQAAEDARRRQLVATGGLHGQAERLAALNQRPDHTPGL
jgi:hypothetical protein